MRSMTAFCVFALLMPNTVSAQETVVGPGDATTLSTKTPIELKPAEASSIVIRRDTPIHLMVVSEVTTKTHAVGHRFRLRVDQPVIVDGVTIVPVGANAWGQVTSATSSGNVGKSGALSAKLLYVELGDVRIAIDGETSDRGKSGTGEVVMGVLGLGLFGLLAKGNNAKIKAGEKMTAFTVEDVAISYDQTQT